MKEICVKCLQTGSNGSCTPASVSIRLPARCFLSGPNRPMTGPMLLTSLVTGYATQAGKLWSTLPIVPVLRTTIALFWTP